MDFIRNRDNNLPKDTWDHDDDSGIFFPFFSTDLLFDSAQWNVNFFIVWFHFKDPYEYFHEDFK